jgi:hypothetical protein
MTPKDETLFIERRQGTGTCPAAASGGEQAKVAPFA